MNQDKLETESGDEKSAENRIQKDLLSYVSLGCMELTLEVEFYREVFRLPEPHWKNQLWAWWQMPTFRLALCSYQLLAQEMGLPEGFQRLENSFSGVIFSQNVNSIECVDEVLSRALKEGASMMRSGECTDWGGYRGFFSSPSGHVWEVCFNPRKT